MAVYSLAYTYREENVARYFEDLVWHQPWDATVQQRIDRVLRNIDRWEPSLFPGEKHVRARAFLLKNEVLRRDEYANAAWLARSWPGTLLFWIAPEEEKDPRTRELRAACNLHGHMLLQHKYDDGTWHPEARAHRYTACVWPKRQVWTRYATRAYHDPVKKEAWRVERQGQGLPIYTNYEELPAGCPLDMYVPCAPQYAVIAGQPWVRVSGPAIQDAWLWICREDLTEDKPAVAVAHAPEPEVRNPAVPTGQKVDRLDRTTPARGKRNIYVVLPELQEVIAGTRWEPYWPELTALGVIESGNCTARLNNGMLKTRVEVAQWNRLWPGRPIPDGFDIADKCYISSHGWGQVMGWGFMHHGCVDALDFRRQLQRDVRHEIRAVITFLDKKGLFDEFEDGAWERLAYQYNGPAHKQTRWMEKFQDALEAVRFHNAQLAQAPDPTVSPLPPAAEQTMDNPPMETERMNHPPVATGPSHPESLPYTPVSSAQGATRQKTGQGLLEVNDTDSLAAAIFKIIMALLWKRVLPVLLGIMMGQHPGVQQNIHDFYDLETAVPAPRPTVSSPAPAVPAASAATAGEPHCLTTVRTVNIRSGPSIDAPDIGNLFKGQSVCFVAPANNGWIEIAPGRYISPVAFGDPDG